MKNEKEFRDAVYEKARLYEKRRRAKQRRRVEITALCSVCVAIGISACLLFPNFRISVDEGAPVDVGKYSHDGYHQSSGGTLEDQELSGAGSTEVPACTTLYQTTSAAPAMTYASTAAHPVTSTEETVYDEPYITPTLAENVVLPKPDKMNAVPCHLSLHMLASSPSDHGIFMIKSVAQLRTFDSEHRKLYSDTDRKALFSVYDNAYFTHSILIIVIGEMETEGYRICFRNGYASFVEAFGEGADSPAAILHTFDIPISQYESWNLLQYGEN